MKCLFKDRVCLDCPAEVCDEAHRTAMDRRHAEAAEAQYERSVERARFQQEF